MTPPIHSSLTARVAPALFVLLWSTGFVVAKYAMPYAPPLGFLVLRFAFACAVLTPLIMLARAPWPNLQVTGHLIVSGVLVHCAYLSGVWCAVKLGMPASLVALIVNMQPIATALLLGMLGEPVSRRQWFGLALGLAGVMVVLSNKLSILMGAATAGAAQVSVAGLLLSIMALAGITGGSLYQKRFVPTFDLRSGTLIQYLAGVVLLAPLWLLLESEPFVWNASLWIAMLWSVLALSIVAIFLMFYLIRTGSAESVASLFYLVPPGTALMAWFLFDESWGWREALGLLMTAVAVAIVAKNATLSAARH